MNSLQASVNYINLSISFFQSISDLNCSECWPFSGFNYLIYNKKKLSLNCTMGKF